jgi:transcriptional regulator with XRE-family HTH domain
MDKATPAPRRVTRVQLGILLREWRDRAGLSSKDAADLLEWHPSKLSKVEKGAARISAAELDLLLDKYGVPAEEAERMRALGKEARKRGVAGRVPDWGQTYVELEQGADEIRMYYDELIPGVLQTDDYARALLATDRTRLLRTSRSGWHTGSSDGIDCWPSLLPTSGSCWAKRRCTGSSLGETACEVSWPRRTSVSRSVCSTTESRSCRRRA